MKTNETKPDIAKLEIAAHDMLGEWTLHFSCHKGNAIVIEKDGSGECLLFTPEDAEWLATQLQWMAAVAKSNVHDVMIQGNK